MSGCCQSCDRGLTCESDCKEAEPALILDGGYPRLRSRTKNMACLIGRAHITPGLLGSYLQASQPVTGFPSDVAAASRAVALKLDPMTETAAFMTALVALWKTSREASRQGWADPSADHYMTWLGEALGKGDVQARQIVAFAKDVCAEAGHPDWLRLSLARLESRKPTTQGRARVAGYHRPTRGGYR